MRQVSCLIVTVIFASVVMMSQGQVPVPVPPGYKVKKGKDDKGRDVQYARTGHVTNYDESKVKAYTLPDPLTLLNGAPVPDADTWFKKRRPEILEMFRTEYIGHVPANAPQVKWEVASSDPKAKDGSAIMKKVVGKIGDTADGPRVNLTLYIPARAAGRVPVILTVAGNLNKWVGRWNEMPIDSHMLIALMAPRGFFCNGGTTDQWADPKGEFLAMVAAGPVYKLLGGKDLGVTELPPLDQPLLDSDLGWIYHTGGHICPPGDWRAFYDFADRHFKKK